MLLRNNEGSCHILHNIAAYQKYVAYPAYTVWWAYPGKGDSSSSSSSSRHTNSPDNGHNNAGAEITNFYVNIRLNKISYLKKDEKDVLFSKDSRVK